MQRIFVGASPRLALSDVRLMLASPFGSLKRGKLKTNAAEILLIARRENAGASADRRVLA